MSIRAGIVVAVALKQIDRAPDTEASAKGDHEGLKNLNCTVKESHIVNLAGSGNKDVQTTIRNSGFPFKIIFLKVAVLS